MTPRTMLDEKNKLIADLQQKMMQLQLEVETKIIEAGKGTDEEKAKVIAQLPLLRQQIAQHLAEQEKIQGEKEAALLDYHDKANNIAIINSHAAPERKMFESRVIAEKQAKELAKLRAIVQEQVKELQAVIKKQAEELENQRADVVTKSENLRSYLDRKFGEIETDYINSKRTLFDAARSDNLKQLELILTAGVDISQTDETGDTVLHISAKKPLTETNQSIINIILDLYPASFYAVNKAGKSAIEEAAMTADWAKLNWLDDKGKGITPYSRSETLNKLYAVASSENKKKLANKQLHEGSKQGNLEAIDQALREGADINDITYGATALYNAVDCQHEKCIIYLLAKEADELIPCGSQNAYDITVTKRDTHTMMLLANKMLIHSVLENNKAGVAEALAKNADIGTATYTQNETALHLASASGNDGIVNLLIDSKANIYQKDDSGQVALHKAAAKGHEAVLQCLIQQHVKLRPNELLCDIEDAKKKTPLHSAGESSDPKLQHKMNHWAGLFSAQFGSQILSIRGVSPNAAPFDLFQ